VKERGDGGVGTTYLNTSEFLGRTTELRYVVEELVPGQSGSGSAEKTRRSSPSTR